MNYINETITIETPADALVAFSTGYLRCALWADAIHVDTGLPDEDCTYAYDPLVPADTIENWDQTEMVLSTFLSDNWNNLTAAIAAGRTWDDCGYDLWLTRNHHGAGFWDRGLGEVGERLTVAAEALHGASVYVDDGPTVIIE